MQSTYKFFLIGLIVAGLEEFITQGVLKNNPTGWIASTIIAFLPFLIIVWLMGKFLTKKLPEPKAVFWYYILAGSIGLGVEWFLIGLTPWSAPHILQIPFQLGMFSFWGTVAFAPLLLLDTRKNVSIIRKWYKCFLIFGLTTIYLITFTAKKEDQFPLSITATLSVFILLNFFYFKYIRRLHQS